MTNTTRTFMIAVAIPAFLALHDPVQAVVTFEWVPIGQPGNPPDPFNVTNIPGIGSVPYEYSISKHEVTNQQYVAFLNAVATSDPNNLYNPNMTSNVFGGIVRNGLPDAYTYSLKPNMGNKPATFVSFLDVLRFVNWLHNGQPVGPQNDSTTENGVYVVTDGLTEVRAPDAQFFLPTENEWYKAAYYQPASEGGDFDNYWIYPVASNTTPLPAMATPTGEIANPGVGVINYDSGAIWNGEIGNVTSVGSAGPGSESYFGTSDQGGNVYEFVDGFFNGFRVVRGGCFFVFELDLLSSTRYPVLLEDESGNVGFRIARPMPSAVVPTVSDWGVIAMTLLMLVAGTIVVRHRCPTAVGR
jgi:formylglycine-generating enzyme required for sulfatase activity